MIHQILQSDIDLAKRLANAGHSDEHIVEVLCLRGIPRVRAAQLTDDIRQGNEVQPEFNYLPEMEIPSGDDTPQEPLEPAPRIPERRHSRRPTRRRSPFVWAGVLLLTLLCAAALVYAFNRHHATPTAPEPAASGAESERSSDPEARPEPAPIPAPPETKPPESRQSIRLNLTKEGLLLGKRQLTSTNILHELCRALGAPTRTNAVTTASEVTYGFDEDGLLLNASASPSLLIDLDGAGLPDGCRRGFSGEFRIGANAIGSGTPAETIAALSSTGTSVVGVDGGTLTCQFGATDLSFLYLTNCSHLSLVHIRLTK